MTNSAQVTLDSGERLWGDTDSVLYRGVNIVRRAYENRPRGQLHVFQHILNMPGSGDIASGVPPTLLSQHWVAYLHWYGGEFEDLHNDDHTYQLPVEITTTFRHQRRGWVYGWDRYDWSEPWLLEPEAPALDEMLAATGLLYDTLMALIGERLIPVAELLITFFNHKTIIADGPHPLIKHILDSGFARELEPRRAYTITRLGRERLKNNHQYKDREDE